jgi:cell division septation protein DedD
VEGPAPTQDAKPPAGSEDTAKEAATASHAPAAGEAGHKKEKEEQFTFYKTLPAKNEQIVPLTPDKKKAKDRPIVFPPLPQEKTPVAGKEGGKANPADEFTVQVAALKERKSAEDFVAALKTRGREAYILPLKSEDHGTLYRVRVGHYPTKKDALKVAETLSQEGLNSFVVKGD